MQWSKTKSLVESFLCEKLQGRVHIYATVYRKFHDQPSRVWITVDKKEIVSGADTAYFEKHAKQYKRMKAKNSLKSIQLDNDWQKMMNSPERKALVEASQSVDALLKTQTIFASADFYEAFMKYPLLSINDALTNKQPIIQAFAMFDRRVGKRTLLKLKATQCTMPPVVQLFYRMRCEIEGLL